MQWSTDFLNKIEFTQKRSMRVEKAFEKGVRFCAYIYILQYIATLPPNSIFYLLIRLPPPLPSILNTFVAAAYSIVFLAYQYLWQIQIKTFCVPFDSLQFLKWTQFRVSNERGVSIPPCFCIRNRKACFRRGTSSLAVKTINSMTNVQLFLHISWGFQFESRQSIVKANLP